MRVEFAADALSDLDWLEAYCRQHSQKAMLKAQAALDSVFDEISVNPFIGRKHDRYDVVRSFPLPKMPFRIYYTVLEDSIVILRIWDVRGRPSSLKF